jgi:K+-sensing histidine kinase KdpD
MPSENLVIMGNDTHLTEALSNLIDNAVKYSNSGNTVTITLAKEKGLGSDEAVMSVSDHGIGIPEEEQQRLFQRFYRASNSEAKDAQGTGLGLYIVKRVVDYHGGSISFVSNLNQGTTFKLRFPLVKTAVQSTTSPIGTPLTSPAIADLPTAAPIPTVMPSPTGQVSTIAPSPKTAPAETSVQPQQPTTP